MLRSFLGRGGLAVATVVLGLSLPPRTATADDADTEAAKIHYKAGEQYYVRGLYAQAISEFEEAYRLSKAAALLYNMSQAYERAGDLAAARAHLKRYMDSGQTEPGELPQLQEKLDSLDRRIAEAQRPPPGATPPRAEPPPVVDAGPRRPLKTWKWIVGGAGVGAGALAVLFMLDAEKQEKALEDYLAMNPQSPPFTGEPKDIYDKGKRDNTMSVVFGIGGAALLATGVVLFVLDAQHARQGTERMVIAPVVGPEVVGAAASWSF
jgi:tetratricopeptide (TPR) repeat protein